MTIIRQIPLDDIDDHALIRDRSALNADAMAELTASLRAHGLRLPVEVIRGTGARAYALLSGLRRITAWRALATEAGEDAIPALVRPDMSPAEALAAVIEENEMREPLSAWERGRIVQIACDEGLFASVEEAARALFPTADRVKLSRIRAIAWAVEALGDLLTTPERWSLRQCLRLAVAVRAGFAPVIRAALEAQEAQAGDEWRILSPYVEEAEAPPEDAKPIRERPKRLSHPRRGRVMRREKTRVSCALHFTGRDLGDMLMDRVFDEVGRMLGTGGA